MNDAKQELREVLRETLTSWEKAGAVADAIEVLIDEKLRLSNPILNFGGVNE